MNYRHVFHAGNFADLIKHAVLSELLARRAPAPLTVVDTHAGAGAYDLAGEAARKTGEGAAVATLMADGAAPPVFDALKAAVLRHAPLYPGSPLLIAEALRPGDRLIACELRADDFAALARRLEDHRSAQVLNQDGWKVAPPSGQALVLIDPPYELNDDTDRAAAATARVLARNPAAIVAVWAPIKDLAAFDALLMGMEEAAAALLVAEVRLRSLDNPTTLNGCAMVVANAPAGLDGPAADAARWIAGAMGETTALGRAWRVGS